eukprot:gnl/MRDRNA2_/MRDRNA2_292305_c0_seq1.p1 gnl/MRDRNA2_/MRDRNA2_292305_c0~~gnl/MRDRNA2_/MRDRNA2_292305_c0_seq1.p1  ORF type:complete len:264 (+),score=39.67 gnl/MRDRNA2_/MRDRNA2_292305_c0_seq1:3-794(+)
MRANNLASEFDLRLLPGSATDNAELSGVCQNGAVRSSSPAEYLAKSGRGVYCFFEGAAFNEDGHLQCSPVNAVTKIGHALHDLDAQFRNFTRSTSVAEVFRSLDYISPVPVQSMVMFKQPDFPNEVTAHQDSSYLYTEPLSTVGFWVALEDANEGNGCMQVVPGSHHGGVSRRMVLMDGGPASTFIGDAQEPTDEEYVSLPVNAGDAIVFDGGLWHRSGPNHSNTTRIAYTFHSIEGTCKYAHDNWLQPGLLAFEPLYNQAIE